MRVSICTLSRLIAELVLYLTDFLNRTFLRENAKYSHFYGGVNSDAALFTFLHFTMMGSTLSCLTRKRKELLPAFILLKLPFISNDKLSREGRIEADIEMEGTAQIVFLGAAFGQQKAG